MEDRKRFSVLLYIKFNKNNRKKRKFINTVLERKKSLNLNQNNVTFNSNKNLYFIVDKINWNEYISNNSCPSEGSYLKEELTKISEKDEQTIIKYLLELMRKHDIITKEEYDTVLYKYS